MTSVQGAGHDLFVYFAMHAWRSRGLRGVHWSAGGRGGQSPRPGTSTRTAAPARPSRPRRRRLRRPRRSPPIPATYTVYFENGRAKTDLEGRGNLEMATADLLSLAAGNARSRAQLDLYRAMLGSYARTFRPGAGYAYEPRITITGYTDASEAAGPNRPWPDPRQGRGGGPGAGRRQAILDHHPDQGRGGPGGAARAGRPPAGEPPRDDIDRLYAASIGPRLRVARARRLGLETGAASRRRRLGAIPHPPFPSGCR